MTHREVKGSECWNAHRLNWRVREGHGREGSFVIDQSVEVMGGFATEEQRGIFAKNRSEC